MATALPPSSPLKKMMGSMMGSAAVQTILTAQPLGPPTMAKFAAACTLPTCLGFWKSEYGTDDSSAVALIDFD